MHENDVSRKNIFYGSKFAIAVKNFEAFDEKLRGEDGRYRELNNGESKNKDTYIPEADIIFILGDMRYMKHISRYGAMGDMKYSKKISNNF